jgi:ABC-2 type transport system ATP-binding protein
MVLAPSAAGEVLLEKVSRKFGQLVLLRAVDLLVQPGTVTEIVGDNGTGKTSLLRILAGTLAPDSGRVEVVGRPPGRGMASLVPAGDRALYWRLTGRQELEFYARISCADRDQAVELAAEAAALMEVDGFSDRQIGTCSTGQRRRLMFARSLVGRAPVLLLDEPYADLDEAACQLVGHAVRKWTDQGGLALWTSPTRGGGPRPDRTLTLREGELTHG